VSTRTLRPGEHLTDVGLGPAIGGHRGAVCAIVTIAAMTPVKEGDQEFVGEHAGTTPITSNTTAMVSAAVTGSASF
jgi:hypothetical protein